MTSIQEADSLGERGRQEEELVVFTLYVWEKRKAGAKPSTGGACTSSSREEELARQLQNQFDLDDYHVSVSAYFDH